MSNTTQDKPELSQQPQQQNPPVLEEDDEFEDFPVEGRQYLPFYREGSRPPAVHRRQPPTQLPSYSKTQTLTQHHPQTGTKKKPKKPPEQQMTTHTCGRRAGMTMMPPRISRNNYSAFPACLLSTHLPTHKEYIAYAD